MIEPLAIGSHAVERAEIAPNDTILLVGAGPIGMMVLSMGTLKGARFIVTDTNEERLQFVRDKFKGVECVPANDQLTASLSALLNGDAPVKVIEYDFGFLHSLKLENPVLANAFITRDVPYYWKKGKIEQWN